MAVTPQSAPLVLLRALRSRVTVLIVVLLMVWLALPFVPDETGLRFGWVYQVFFSVLAILAVVFFWFLGKERIGRPERPATVIARVAAVYLVTVGLLVVAGVVYPQFPIPQAKKTPAQGGQAAERGRELFLNPSVGCFRCHAIAGQGGIRGPDLTTIASRAAARVRGLTAREYLLEKVRAGSTFDFKVPKYAPMMPTFKALVSEEEIEDLVAYLMTLKGASTDEVEGSEPGG